MKAITENLKFADIFPEKAAEFAQRLHIKKDEIPFVRKYYTAEKDKSEIKKKERAVVSYISTGIKDRDGEKLVPEGAVLENYQKNPIVPFAHDYKSIPPAKNMWIKRDEKGLVAKTVFAKNQRADEIYKAYTEDVGGTGPLLNAFSVGFIPLEWEDTDAKTMEKDSSLPKRIYNKWELLEYSLVPIPSCAEALTIAVEKGLISKKLQKALEIEVVKDEPEKIDKEIRIELEPIETITHPVAKDIEVGKTTSGEQEIEIEKDIKIQFGSPKEEGGYFAVGEESVKALNELEEKIITKPETTEKYHHIPVNPGCTITATITISSDKGIKATYCGGTKKIHTYLFDVNKWTMAEAQAWVKENHKRDLEEWIQKTAESEPQHKERWNKSLSKLFDIASAESSAPMRFHYDLYEKFLECKIKEVFQQGYTIPSPLMGSYLAAYKEILSKFDLKDTRRFSYSGDETPPNYEVVQLNSEKSDDFLIDGMQFYEAEKRPLIVNYSPEWYGINVTLTTSTVNKKWNKDLLDKVHAWVQKNNFLRGEKFALSGEFLKEPGDSWDNLILKDKYKDAIMMSAKALETKGEKLVGRGLLFIGPPGTGKTKTGRVLMNELDATFIWVSSRDFRHIGPLRALAIGFSMARDLAPSVLFLEDIDTWLRGEMEFVTDSLKTEMDGIKQNRGMITIMTSNYPEKLPPALLDRPGRFHHIVNFELPDEEQRKDMIKLWAGDIDEKLIDKLAERTGGFSGAHLKELVEFAKMIAEEEEIEIGNAMLLSLDKLMEQRELIEEIRENAEDAKAVWGRVKYVNGEIEIAKEKELVINVDAMRSFLTPEAAKVMTETIKANMPRPKLSEALGLDEKENKDELYEKLLEEKDDHIADLKEGRVLSRKNRDVVKAAIKALGDVLTADAAGTQEDTDSAGEGTVTEREPEIEIIKDGEKEFSKEDIAKVIKETSGLALVEAVEKALKENLNPEKLKEAMKEVARVELQRIRGKVE